MDPDKRLTRQIARFRAHFEVAEGCWLWTGPLNVDGYASFEWGPAAKGEKRDGHLGHRFAFLLEHGRLPIGVCDHQCHNEDPTCPGGRACLHRRCVRPSHLRDVTQGENLTASGRVGRQCPQSVLPDGRTAFHPVVSRSGIAGWDRLLLGIGSPLAGQRVTVIPLPDDELEVLDQDGRFLHRFVLDRTQKYQPSGRPVGRWR